MNRLTTAALAAAVFAAAATAEARPPGRAPTPDVTLESAAVVLDELAAIPDKSIPASLLAEAHGVIVFPRVIKAGFVFAGRGGHGVVLARDKTGAWGDPVFVNLGGGSVGFQAGVESTDVVLVFRDRKSLDRILDGKGKVTLGADASVAAGPLGRQAAAATDAKLEAEIVSYSRSRGAFAGVSLDGTVIKPDANSNAMYQADKRPDLAARTTALKATLTDMSAANPPARPQRLAPPVVGQPVPVPVPVPVPQPVPVPVPQPLPR